MCLTKLTILAALQSDKDSKVNFFAPLFLGTIAKNKQRTKISIEQTWIVECIRCPWGQLSL
jgi:hypothetical protein